MHSSLYAYCMPYTNVHIEWFCLDQIKDPHNQGPNTFSSSKLRKPKPNRKKCVKHERYNNAPIKVSKARSHFY